MTLKQIIQLTAVTSGKRSILRGTCYVHNTQRLWQIESVKSRLVKVGVRQRVCPKVYTVPVDGNQNFTALRATKGLLRVDKTGDYSVWLRMFSPKTESNSVYLQIDGQCPVAVGDKTSGNSFEWVNTRDGTDTPIKVSLTKGSHTIVLAGREAGTGVDEVIVTQNTSCTPVDFGTNCLEGAAAEAVLERNAAVTEDQHKSTPPAKVAAWRYGVMTAAVAVAIASTGIFLTWLHHFRKPGSRLHDPLISELFVGGNKLPLVRLPGWVLHIFRHPKIMVPLYSAVMAIALVAAIVAAQPGLPVLEAEAGTLSGGAKIVDNTEASGGKYVMFEVNPAGTSGTTSSNHSTGGSSGGSSSSSGGSGSTGGGGTSGTGGSTSSCALPKYPTPSCTGTPSGTSLTTINGNYNATTNGEVINAKRITGDLIILANNVVITNSEIDGTIYNDQGLLHGSFTVTDTTIGPASGCIGQPAINDSNYVATRVRSRGHDDGFRVGPPGNVKVYDSYVENCYLPPSQAPPDGSHSDGVQAVCGGTACSGVTIVHNTFDGTKVPTTNMLNLTDTDLSNVTATDNLMAGGAYVVDAWWHSGAVWTIKDNRFVNNSWAYGAVTAENTCSHQSWSGNTLVTIDSSYNITSTVGSQPCVE